MAISQAHATKEGLTETQIRHDVVAAILAAPSNNASTSVINMNQHEEGQRSHSSEEQEELPPYESVSAESFVIDVRHIQHCSSANLMQMCSYQSLSISTAGCLPLCTCDDFVLFPLHTECCSEQESSVVSCFTDGLSRSTESTASSSCEVVPDLTGPPLACSRNAVPEGLYRDDDQKLPRSTTNIVNWLCHVEPGDSCRHVAGIFPQELINVDEQDDAIGTTDAGQDGV